MKTFIQTNFNECGVCAISSYVEHFYNKNKKTEILDEANITRNGLSLYDFEILASKFGLDCHSYELQCEELYSNKISKYFVALLKNESGLHYVICSLKDKSFHI
jgi:ABC-type bacteriocin/lantibiotic exporter with double-glycine peptidase domain